MFAFSVRYHFWGQREDKGSVSPGRSKLEHKHCRPPTLRDSNGESNIRKPAPGRGFALFHMSTDEIGVLGLGYIYLAN